MGIIFGLAFLAFWMVAVFLFYLGGALFLTTTVGVTLKEVLRRWKI